MKSVEDYERKANYYHALNQAGEKQNMTHKF